MSVSFLALPPASEHAESLFTPGYTQSIQRSEPYLSLLISGTYSSGFTDLWLSRISTQNQKTATTKNPWETKVRNYHESRQAGSAGKGACCPARYLFLVPGTQFFLQSWWKKRPCSQKLSSELHMPPQINRKIKISVENVHYFYWAKYKTMRTVCHALWTWVHKNENKKKKKNENKPQYSKSTEHIAPNFFTAPGFSCFRACCVAAFFPFGSDQWEHNHPVSSGLAFETY